MSDAALNALLDGRQARTYGICAICGEPRTVQVYVRLSELGDQGTTIPGRSASASATLCTKHGLAAYEVGREAIGR